MPTIKTRRKTGWIALTFHWTMIICTCGLWYPIYASRRRSRVTVTHVPAGYGQPPAYYPPRQYGNVPPQQWGPPRR
jgi:hypothetical protein